MLSTRQERDSEGVKQVETGHVGSQLFVHSRVVGGGNRLCFGARLGYEIIHPMWLFFFSFLV